MGGGGVVEVRWDCGRNKGSKTRSDLSSQKRIWEYGGQETVVMAVLLF